MNFVSILQNIKKDASRDGYAKAIAGLLYYAANKIFYIRRFEVIYLTRAYLAPLEAAKYAKHSYRVATKEELEGMHANGNWSITDELLEGFRKDGDICILSFVDGKLGGYTWIHLAGHPEWIPGLRVSIPKNYMYNFAAYTHPDFRGFNLQPYRHNVILNDPQWSSKEGMIGYVDCMNWNSKRGQSKSGYQRLGYLTLFGTKKFFATFISRDVKTLGIRRI